jgi:hypothetical protein
VAVEVAAVAEAASECGKQHIVNESNMDLFVTGVPSGNTEKGTYAHAQMFTHALFMTQRSGRLGSLARRVWPHHAGEEECD